MSHINELSINQLNSQVTEFGVHQKENREYEIEAELKKASARTYANPALIR